jgi:hypothetical protein
MNIYFENAAVVKPLFGVCDPDWQSAEGLQGSFSQLDLAAND